MNFKQMPQVLKQTAKAMALAGVLGLSACGGSPGAGPVERFESTQVFGVPGVWDHQTGIIWAAALAQEGGPQVDLLPYAAELLSIADGPADIWQDHFPWVKDSDLRVREEVASDASAFWSVHIGGEENGSLSADTPAPKTWYVLSRTNPPATPSLLMDAGEGVVRDARARLMWQLCSSLPEYEQGCAGSDGALLAYGDLDAHVKSVNDAKYAGYDDWRLPTKQELQALMQLDGSPSLLPTAFGGDGVSPAAGLPYWTQSRSAQGFPWVVDFSGNAEGSVFLNAEAKFPVNSPAYVRLVRNLP